MNRDFRAVWERYVDSWSAETSAEKRRLLAETVAPACVYRDPLIEAKGWDELVAYIGEFQKQVPGARFVTQSFMVHHGRSMAQWHMVGPAGAKLGEGTSIGEYGPDGQLVAMTGFFETAPPAA